jgi:RNA-directed DNA polymerase
MESPKGKTSDVSKSGDVSTKQRRIAQLAKQAPEMGMNLSHHMDLEWFKEAYRRTRKEGAVGIDGQNGRDYAVRLEENLCDLINRAKSGQYRAPAVRRKQIPKAGNPAETRPIGIPTFEDKVLQRAVVMALEPVFEQDFLGCSYGFRPGRSAHQALRDLREGLRTMGGGYVIDLDIRKYFDTIDHHRIQEMFCRRVRDGVIRRLVGKWLNAGVMEHGLVIHPETGVPQGGVISPMLSNIYLHEVLDSWFLNMVQPRLRGKSFMVRFADDAVLAFEHKQDAERVMAVLPKRFAKYGLELHPEKTKLLCFKPPTGGYNGTGVSDTFVFLGFTHFWARSRRGYWVIKRKTAKDRFSRFLKVLSQWLRKVRHEPICAQHKTLSAKLRGHFQYYGITGNSGALSRILWQAHRIWRKWLGRRSSKAHRTWEWFNQLLQRFPLPKPRVIHQC